MAEDPEDIVMRQQTLQHALTASPISVEALRFMALDDEVNNRLFKKPMMDPATNRLVLVTDPEYEQMDKLNTLMNSPLTRTTIITEKKERDKQEIRKELILLKLKAQARQKGSGYSLLVDGLNWHYNSIISDSWQGHRSKLWGERRVVARVERRQKKKRFGGLFG